MGIEIIDMRLVIVVSIVVGIIMIVVIHVNSGTAILIKAVFIIDMIFIPTR